MISGACLIACLKPCFSKLGSPGGFKMKNGTSEFPLAREQKDEDGDDEGKEEVRESKE